MHKQRNWLSFLVATFLFATAGQQNVGLCQGDHVEFFATVQDRFSKWDRNNDGVLTEAEIVQSFQSPNCRGSAAAAIAVLQQIETHHLIKKEPLQSFTLSDFNRMQSEPGHNKTQAKFEGYLKKIQSRSKVLFAHDLPQIDDVVQGDANDCYILAVVASLSRERPKDLMRLIETNDDGAHTVHFPGVAAIKIHCITDAEVSSYNSTSDGMWLPILLKAYGRMELKRRWNTPQETPVYEDPLEAIAIHGGDCTWAVKVLSGHAVNSRKPKDIQADIRKQIVAAFDEHHMVMCGVPHHAMALLGYDRKSDQVQIWNPWGSKHFKELDLEMDHGFFSIPMSKFIEKCNNIMFELAENASPERNSPGKKRDGGTTIKPSQLNKLESECHLFANSAKSFQNSKIDNKSRFANSHADSK